MSQDDIDEPEEERIPTEDLPPLPPFEGEYDKELFYYWDAKGIPTDEHGDWVRMMRVFTLGGHDVQREYYDREEE